MKKYSLMVLMALASVLTTAFSQEGELLNRTDEDGKKHGKWVKMDKDSNVLYKGRFEHGMPIDTFSYYYPGGKLKAKAAHVIPGKAVYVKSFYKNGNLKAEGKYTDKAKDSVWRFYRKEGRLVSEERFNNDKHEGESVYYYYSGDTLKVTPFDEGKPHGVEKTYYEEGGLNKKQHYDNGMLHGRSTVFYPDGDTMTTGTYYREVKQGEWRYYNEEQKLIRREKYRDGSLVEEENFEE